MPFALALLDLAGAVALLLWGVRMVQTGVQRTSGARLRGAPAAALRNRARAFLAGIGITAALQSSTATGLMVTGFAAGGLVEPVPALAVMLGANVGTTLIVQALSFDVAAAAPALDPEAMAAAERRRAGRVLAFAEGAQAELIGALDRVLANLRAAASLLVTEDVRAARLLAAERAAFRELESRAEAAQLERLRAGRSEAAEADSLRLDILRDLKGVNACLVAAAAYPVLEGEGELLPTRLRRAAGE